MTNLLTTPQMKRIAQYAKEHGMGQMQFKRIVELHTTALCRRMRQHQIGRSFGRQYLIERYYAGLAAEVKYQCLIIEENGKTEPGQN